MLPQQLHIHLGPSTDHQLELIPRDTIKIGFRHHLIQPFLNPPHLQYSLVNPSPLNLPNISISLFISNFYTLTIVDYLVLLTITCGVGLCDGLGVLLELLEHLFGGDLVQHFQGLDELVVALLDVAVGYLLSHQ